MWRKRKERISRQAFLTEKEKGIAMLGKLLKYEVKTGFMTFPGLYAAIVALFALGRLSRYLEIEQMTGAMALAIAAVGLATMVLAVVGVVQRFYGGMFGSEGYLTQTLPAGKGTLLAAKAIAAYGMMLLGVIGLVGALALAVNLAELHEIVDSFLETFGGVVTPAILYLTVISLVKLLGLIGLLYFAVCLANTRPFLRNNLVCAVVFFFIGYMVLSLLEVGAVLLIPLGVQFSASGSRLVADTMLNSMLKVGFDNTSVAVSEINFGLGSVLVDLAVGIGLLFGSRWLLEHKASVK